MADRQQRGVGMCAMAAAAAGVCAVTSSLNFVVGRPAVNQPSVATGLRGAAQQGAADSGMSSTMLGLAGAGTLAAAAVASKGAVRRERPAMRAGMRLDDWSARSREWEAKKREKFAGGLIGSDYAGWDRYEFDPLCLSDRFPESVPWFREAELKHGRVAMLAYVGLIFPDLARLPISPLDDASLDAVNAHSKLIGPGLGEGPMWWLLLACGVLESIRFKQLGLGFEKLNVENAGDCGVKLFAPTTAEGMEQMKVKELKNGRLAMLAFGGAITQAVAFDAHHFPFTP